MLRPSPNHGTQRLPNDDDDDAKQCIPASGHSSSARPRTLTLDVTMHRAPSLDVFRHFRFYCSNFAVKYLIIIADILVIRPPTYS